MIENGKYVSILDQRNWSLGSKSINTTTNITTAIINTTCSPALGEHISVVFLQHTKKWTVVCHC